MYKVVRGIKFGLIFRSTFFFQNCFKTERLEWIAQPTVELAHKFHPENVKCIQLKKNIPFFTNANAKCAKMQTVLP
jgi:hypothetical protein